MQAVVHMISSTILHSVALQPVFLSLQVAHF